MSETKGDVVKTYTYDANGNRTSFVAPSINVNTSYTYDSLGRMLTVSDEAFGTTSYTYDANSNVTRVANGATTATMSYDAQNRLVSKFSGADTYTLTYYNDGNVKRVTDSEGTINYTYNETGALASGDGATYKYDIYGNRSEMTKDGSTYRYYYDRNNRLIREADFAGNIASAYRYDNNGNLIERTHMPEPTTPTENASATLSVVSAPTFTTDTFTFDVLDRMSSATVNGTTTNYTYDGNGLRQTKNNKQFVYDGVNIVWEGESLATGTTYYRGLELIARSSNHSFARYQTDWHGNIEGYSYDDFGNPTGGNTANPFRYNGEYYDNETGFIYLRARYYDPEIGRFVSEDPHWNLNNMIYGDEEYKEGEKRQPDVSAILQSNNRYVYCVNNPISYLDPYGKFLYACYSWYINSLSGNKQVNFSISMYMTSWGIFTPPYKLTASLYRDGVAVASKTGDSFSDFPLTLSAGTGGKTAYWKVKIDGYFGDDKVEYSTFEVLFNKNGKRYPGSYRDSKSGKTMGDPASLSWVKVTNPVSWTSADRNAYRKWYEQNYNNGEAMDWSGLEIHHIRPRAYGGTNEYSNLIVMPKNKHQEYTSWWAGY